MKAHSIVPRPLAPRPRGRRRTVRLVAVASWIVRLAAAGASVALGGCASRGVARVEAIAPEGGMQLTASLSATVDVSPESILLRVTDGRVTLGAPSPGDSAAASAIRELALRAVVVADSSGRLIPLGVSSPYLVPGVMRAGEVRELRGAEFALPVPEGVRLAEAWVVFELRGVEDGIRGGERTITTLVCSQGTLSASRSSAALRFSDRLRSNYADACRL